MSQFEGESKEINNFSRISTLKLYRTVKTFYASLNMLLYKRPTYKTLGAIFLCLCTLQVPAIHGSKNLQVLAGDHSVIHIYQGLPTGKIRLTKFRSMKKCAKFHKNYNVMNIKIFKVTRPVEVNKAKCISSFDSTLLCCIHDL